MSKYNRLIRLQTLAEKEFIKRYIRLEPQLTSLFIYILKTNSTPNFKILELDQFF